MGQNETWYHKYFTTDRISSTLTRNVSINKNKQITTMIKM